MHSLVIYEGTMQKLCIWLAKDASISFFSSRMMIRNINRCKESKIFQELNMSSKMMNLLETATCKLSFNVLFNRASLDSLERRMYFLILNDSHHHHSYRNLRAMNQAEPSSRAKSHLQFKNQRLLILRGTYRGTYKTS